MGANAANPENAYVTARSKIGGLPSAMRYAIPFAATMNVRPTTTLVRSGHDPAAQMVVAQTVVEISPPGFVQTVTTHANGIISTVITTTNCGF